MPALLKYAIGLDMSMKKFDACLVAIDDQQRVIVKSTRSNINNTPQGFEELLVWTKKHVKFNLPICYVAEATGVYHEQLAWHLHLQDCHLSIILPNQTKHYLRSLGIKTKNDKIDAKGLATMAAQRALVRWQPISNNLYELRQLTRYHQQLQESKTSFQNQWHAFSYNRLQNTMVFHQLQELIHNLEQQIKQTKVAIEHLVTNDPVLHKKIQYISSVKGLALVSIATVVAETNGFELFKNIPQLVSYSGYDVIENQSGEHRGKTRISKKGNSRIRRILFMPAFNVVTHEVYPFKQLYDRVFERTKQKMKAYVAVQRKLLITIYTLWKKEEKFKYATNAIKNKSKDLSRHKQIHPEMGTRLLSFRLTPQAL